MTEQILDEEKIRPLRVKEMEYKEELDILDESLQIEGTDIILNKLMLRDYREKKDPTYSVLCLRWFWKDYEVYETQYDTGRADKSLLAVKRMIHQGLAFFDLNGLVLSEASMKFPKQVDYSPFA